MKLNQTEVERTSSLSAPDCGWNWYWGQMAPKQEPAKKGHPSWIQIPLPLPAGECQ